MLFKIMVLVADFGASTIMACGSGTYLLFLKHLKSSRTMKVET
jgi:hypothetical protein